MLIEQLALKWLLMLDLVYSMNLVLTHIQLSPLLPCRFVSECRTC